MRRLQVGELILDFSLYPRQSIDPQNVTHLREALDAGVSLPPVVACGKTLRVVDGFHRVRTYLHRHGPTFEVDVDDRDYANDAELFADAIRFNSAHGRGLTSYDRAHCTIVAQRINLPADLMARCMNITPNKLSDIRATRLAAVDGPDPRPIPIKRTIRHLNGQTLTQEQHAASKRLSGMDQVFYVNQLTTLIEMDLLDKSNGELMGRIRYLGVLIGAL